MSYDQWLYSQGITAQPNLTETLFLQILRNYGAVFDLYTRGQTPNCDCIDPYYKTADRSCPTCFGSGVIGGYQESPKATFLGIFDSKPEYRNPNQREYARSGPIDKFEGEVYTESKWYEIINLEDILVWKPKGDPTGIELRITFKNPEFTMNSQRIFTKLQVERNPYPIRANATDLKKRM